MEDYYEYLDSNGVTTLYKLIKDDTVALIDSYSVTINGITTNLDNHVNNSDIHTPIATIESMIDTKVSGLVNSAPETLDTLKELSDALGNDPNFATTVANQIGNKASKDDVYTKEETDTLLDGKANSVHSHVVSDITDFPTIPTKLSQLENDMGFGSGSGGVITSISWTNITDKPNFATVATSGSYNDLSNKPTIPKVYNKTLTIQKNGTNVATFTSNSNTDVTADITVPTKVSELSNDSGFITGISWDKITNKPTLAKVATSGSYTDLSNIPTIPTKVSQLENDTGFINALTDVVDTKSNQTINGTKTFTVAPFVSNNATTNGYFIKLNTIARNEVPSQLYHATFRAYDKNNKILGEYCVEKSTTGCSLLNMNVRSEDSNGKQLSESLVLNMSNDGNTVRFYPSSNNKMDLGMSSNKWAKIYSDDVVHTSGNETIAGKKTFSNQMYLGGGGSSYGLISAKDNNSILRLFGGTSPSTGANLDLYGEGLSDGGFSLRARTSDKIVGLDGKVDGTLKWNGKNVALDENLVHKTGREVISGDKIFQNVIYRQADITTSTVEEIYRFTDTNATPCGSIYNRMHWYNNNVYNRHQAYNATSGKDMYFEVLSHNDGSGVVNTGGSVTNNKNLTTVTKATDVTYVATMGWVNNPATSTNVVHRSGDETISGNKTFANNVYCYNLKHPTDNSYFYLSGGSEYDKGAALYLGGISATNFTPGRFVLVARKTDAAVELVGSPDGILNWTGCIESHEFRATTGNAFMAQHSGYTFLIRNDGSNTYFLMSDKDGTPGTWSTARPLIINNSTGVCSINGHADSANYADVATYATTQATSDNSTKIATTAWVRNYVNSVGGSGNNTLGSSISAYWSTSSVVTNTKQASNERNYPECYSNYIDKTPGVGIIYSGAQLYSELNAHANATRELGGSVQNRTYITKVTAQATFSNPISSTGKYLCTTANTVSFRAYAPEGKSAASVINYSATKSIFIRVE